MLQIRNILLINIVAILLLHSIIPHRHHEEMTCAEHAKAHENTKDVIGYLRLAFHEATNYNLENALFQKTDYAKNFDSLRIDFQVNFGFTKSEILYTQINPFFRTLPQKSHLEFFILANGLRAPPTDGFYLS